jgi:endonuclease YncB( thermonuclease family)
MATYLLKPPTVDESPAGFSRLFWRYRIARGDTLLVNGTVVTRLRTPGVDQTQEADYCYQGGHEYILSEAEYTILVNAGYSANITVTP